MLSRYCGNFYFNDHFYEIIFSDLRSQLSGVLAQSESLKREQEEYKIQIQ